uniref:Uncharacterized protein n=1 Tax=Amphimedon queenslandica TaxID=400682 RepID=A0A1X7UXY9_AMPQE
MFGFRKKAEDQESLEPFQGKKECCTIGSFINYMIIINFAAMFLACVIVIGSLGTLQSDLTSAHGGNRSCYMYATFSGSVDDGDCDNKFSTVATHPCDGSMVAFSFFALFAVAFSISLFIKGILHHDLNWTLFLEVPSLIVFTAVVFAICVMISIGNVATCNSIKNYDKCVNHNSDSSGKYCNMTFPNSNADHFKHQTRANLAQNTGWFVFLFIVIALVIYIIRLIVYLRRRKKQSIQRALEREEFQETQEEPKAI